MERILLVEDNPQIMEINTEFLRDCGYEIHQAASAEECRRKLIEITPNLVIMDIMLPDGDGFSLCDEIRMNSRVPILFLSAKTSNDDIIVALRKGGDDYLTKPHDLFVLQAKVEALLRRAKTVPQDYQFRYGCLRFDTQIGTVFCKGEPLNLTQKEYALLFHMAKKRGEMISKEELYEAVWGQSIMTDSNSLWTAISRLKKKVEQYESDFSIDASRSGYAIFMEKRNPV